MTLWDVAKGENAVITGYQNAIDEAVQQRLIDLGFAVGNSVECLRHGPLSGPHVFLAAGSVFALEREVAELIDVQESSAQ